MKRAIKFRVWDNRFRKMYSDGISVQADGAFYLERPDHDGNGIEIAESEHGELAIMQFTGLLDKNGKEIYEGDLLRYKTSPVYTVVFDSSAWKVAARSPDGVGFTLNLNERTNIFEIIGNIHENPELIK